MLVSLLAKAMVAAVPLDNESTQIISKAQAAAVTNLRATSHAFKSGSPAGTFDGPFPALHDEFLHGFFDEASMRETVEKGCAEILLKFGTSWESALNRHVEEVANMCPQWAHVKDSLLSERAVCQALLENPNYGVIGGRAKDIDNQIRLIKQVHGDGHGHLVEVAVLKKAQTTKDFAIETVAITFFVNTVLVEWREIANPQMAIREATKLENEIAPSKITLPKQCADVLAKWKAGDIVRDWDAKVEEKKKATAPTSEASTPSAPAPAPPASEPPSKVSLRKKAMGAKRQAL